MLSACIFLSWDYLANYNMKNIFPAVRIECSNLYVVPGIYVLSPAHYSTYSIQAAFFTGILWVYICMWYWYLLCFFSMDNCCLITLIFITIFNYYYYYYIYIPTNNIIVVYECVFVKWCRTDQWESARRNLKLCNGGPWFYPRPPHILILTTGRL